MWKSGRNKHGMVGGRDVTLKVDFIRSEGRFVYVRHILHVEAMKYVQESESGAFTEWHRS